MNRGVITIATGKPVFLQLAFNLARSFKWWHAESDISFTIITDIKTAVPGDISDAISIRIYEPGQLGEGFSSKLHLDQLADEGQTLFIDSDCLIFDRLDFIFERFKGHAVSVVGGYISAGEWFGDIKTVCNLFSIPHMPKFNGGLYYLEKGDTASHVFQTARDLEKKYDEIGFIKLRNRPNDEVLMAISLQLNGQIPIPDDGTILSDPQACPGGYRINVITGDRWLLNPRPPHPLHRDWYPFEKVSPVIVHFLGYYTRHYPYKREAYRLEKTSRGKLVMLHECLAELTITYPGIIEDRFKNAFRSAYHRFFGIRKIKQSDRL